MKRAKSAKVSSPSVAKRSVSTRRRVPSPVVKIESESSDEEEVQVVAVVPHHEASLENGSTPQDAIELDPDPEQEFDPEEMEDVCPALLAAVKVEAEDNCPVPLEDNLPLTQSSPENPRKRKSMSCSTCVKGFKNAGQLRRHEKKCSAFANLCQFCDLGFDCKRDLTVHMAEEHATADPPTRFPCPHCPELFYTAKGVKSHISKLHGTFKTGRVFHSDGQKVIGTKYPKNLVAPKLPLYWKEISNLKSEFALKKNIFHEEDNEFMIHCINCGIDFSEEIFFDSHLTDCIQNPHYQCCFCGKLKTSIGDDIFKHIVKHYYKHSGHCKLCNVYFINNYNEECHKAKTHKNASGKDLEADSDLFYRPTRSERSKTAKTVQSPKQKKPAKPKPEQKSPEPEDVQVIDLEPEVVPLVSVKGTQTPRLVPRKKTTPSNDSINLGGITISKSYKGITIQNTDPKPHQEKPQESNTKPTPQSSHILNLSEPVNLFTVSNNVRHRAYTKTLSRMTLKASDYENNENNLELSNLINELKVEIALRKHQLLSRKIRVYCAKCETDYLLVEYIDHVMVCFEAGKSECGFCSIVSDIKTAMDFLQHTKIHIFHHSKLMDCAPCGTNYLNHYNYRSHAVTFHGTAMYGNCVSGV